MFMCDVISDRFSILNSKMGGAVSTGSDNNDLVDNLVEANYIKSPEIQRVFRAVDRANYYLEDHRESAYKDLAWKHGHLHMSAPCIYSEVMESLKLQPGMSFLNLGSGTGYLSTMIGLILGPYGVNHGIEIYEDVVEYARERLEHFKKTGTSFDDFDLCEPQFVQGNCLQLVPCQLYDRVYCGAACPQEQENYLKNLIAINGILVMPLNDQLQQIERTGEMTWNVKNVLPVSFASLITPDENAPSYTVDPPDVHFLPLKAACRLCVRKTIRRNIHLDHPELSKIYKVNSKRLPKPSSRRHINIVPMSMGMMILRQFDSEDSDEDEDSGRLSNMGRAEQEANEDVNGYSENSDDEVDNNVSDIERETPRKDISANMSYWSKNNTCIEKKEENCYNSIVELSSHSNYQHTAPSVHFDRSENEDLSDSDKEVPHSLEYEHLKEYLKNGQSNNLMKKSVSTDDSYDDDDMDIVDVLNRNRSKVRGLSPPRKIRYSSNTSADTSETSGIGSLVDEPSELESCHSSEKPSPGSSVEDDGMDCREEDILVKKQNICMYMKERVNQLPVPSTLKSYIIYYRQ